MHGLLEINETWHFVLISLQLLPNKKNYKRFLVFERSWKIDLTQQVNK